MAVPVIKITEQLGSRTYSKEGGKVSASRTFKVWDSANGMSGLLNPTDVTALFGSASTGYVMPIGDVWDEQYLPAQGDLFPETANAYAHSYNLERVSGTDFWTVVWNYKNSFISGTTLQPNEPNYVEWTLDLSAGFVDAWWENPNYPTDGRVGSNESANIITATTRGRQIDVWGEPVSVLRLTTDINISETVESVGGLPAIYTNARAARGCRNSATWQGIPTGMALYLGASVRRIGVNLYSIQHKIQEAKDYHLIQYPMRNATREIATEKKTDGQTRATRVYWRQPFPEFISFDAISSNW